MEQLLPRAFYTAMSQRIFFPVVLAIGVLGLLIVLLISYREPDAVLFVFPCLLATLMGGMHTLWHRKPVVYFGDDHIECKIAPLAPTYLFHYEDLDVAEIAPHGVVFHVQGKGKIKVPLAVLAGPSRKDFQRRVASLDAAAI